MKKGVRDILFAWCKSCYTSLYVPCI